MSKQNYNCIVCANEFDSEEFNSVVLLKINTTNFKVCEACLNNSNPTDDYREVKSIINSYTKFSEANRLFAEIQDILDNRSKK